MGDTVNTTARIEEFCKRTREGVIASADLIDRLELPPGVAKRSLGESAAARQGKRRGALCVD
jgi:adenylate cyclase